MMARKKQCSICARVGDLQQGMCRPCLRARRCEVLDCAWVNTKQDAILCTTCKRESLGAHSARTAMACPQHASPEQARSSLCLSCYSMVRDCDHCNDEKAAVDIAFSCKQSGCKNKIHLCAKCVVMQSATESIYCKSCWYANGMICIYCNTRKGQHKLHFLRGCRPCVQRAFCMECSSPPGDMSTLPTCLMCSDLALWCPTHCTEIE
eukprot:11872009-Karenia_brevis.AAC.1